MIYRFGRFELDERAGELRQAGQTVSLQPKPLALLFLLLKERHRVVSQDEIFEALWPGTAVTSGSLTRAVSHARKAIDDTHKGALLRSFPRRGYRFVGDVAEIGADVPPKTESERSKTGPHERLESVRATEVFVGRDEAMASLHSAWHLAQRGPGRMVLVTGAAGVGKTRLVEVFAEQATEEGALVLFGRSRDGEGVPAFWLWSQVLRELADVGLISSEHDFEGLLSELGDGSDAEQRFRFFDSVAHALVDASRARPLVLVLEDIQWARSPSLRLLEHLSFALAEARLLVMATVRNETRQRGSAVDRSLSILRRHDHCDNVDLSGLSRASIGRLLAEVIGRPPPTELTSELFARTEGVPLYVREAVRLLDERGELRHPERISRRGISLPRHAVDLIRRTLDGLSEESAELVAAGAVLGREFSIGHVAVVSETDRANALDQLEEAVAAGVIEEIAGAAGSYRFTHALYQEAAYEALQAGRRARYHARAAARLESQYAESPTAVIAELAHHHHQSIAVGNPERAYECAILAAEEASRVLAYEQAATHYEQAVDALDAFETIDAMRRLSVLIELGEAHRRAGDRKRRRQVSAEAMKSARALGRNEDFALAAIRFCDVNEWSPDDAEARAAVEEALSLVDPSDTTLRARLTARRAYLGIRLDGSQSIAREAVDLARKSGDPECLQEALYVLLYALAGPDHHDQRRDLSEELANASFRLKNRDTGVIGLLDIGSDYLAIGDRSQALRMRDEVDRLISDQPSLTASWHTTVFDSGWALMDGRIEDVEQMMTDALMLGERIAHPYAQVCFDVHRMQIHRYQRDYDAIAKLFAPGMTTTLGTSHWPRAIVARNELMLGNTARSIELFDELARFDFVDLVRGIRWISTMLEIAHLCAELEDVRRAEILISMLVPVEAQHGILPMTIAYGGPTSYALARLHEMLGDADTAIDYYETALKAASTLGARPIEARIQIDMSGPIARRGDRTRAADLKAVGIALADELGCQL
jgi:DNA-binding winged helix-turn-helix (wHTH) protein/tetratricopeptide (TPR) repeat protein